MPVEHDGRKRTPGLKRLERPRLTRAAGTAVALVVSACVPVEQEYSGQVIDAATGAPVASAEVVIWSRAWGISEGSLVWDKQYTSRAAAGSDGRFSVVHRGATSPRLCARAPGYETVALDLTSTTWEPRVGLVQSRPVPSSIRTGLLLLGNNAAGETVGWNFAEAATLEPDRADLLLRSAPRLHAPMTLFAPGGVRVAPPPRHGAGVSDGEAPESGYLTEMTVDPQRTKTVFVKTRDGRHYARLELSGELSLSLYPPGQKALQIRYVFDPAGGRFLRSEALAPHCPFAEKTVG